MDQAKKNVQRGYDLVLLKKLIHGRGTTLTEKREFQAMHDDISSDIVKHYCMTDEERERVLHYLSTSQIPTRKNLTERLLETVYEIRQNQDLGHYGYHEHGKTPRSSVSEWSLYLVQVLGRTDRGPGPAISQFRQKMLDLSAVALAAAEWADGRLEEWLKENPPRD